MGNEDPFDGERGLFDGNERYCVSARAPEPGGQVRQLPDQYFKNKILLLKLNTKR